MEAYTYISTCCGAEIADGIAWVNGEGISRCPECYEGCTVEKVEEEKD